MAQLVKQQQQETPMTGERQQAAAAAAATRQQAAAATAAGPEQQQQQQAAASPSACPTKVTTAAWVPRVKQQAPQPQPAVPEERKAVPSAVHDLGSDLLVEQTDSASGGSGKGKNRSRSKKMNWKPLPVPIIRRDPHDRERDIRGSTRKYGFSGMAGAPVGGKKQSPALANGFRNGSGGAGGNSGPHHHNNNNLNHQVNQNAGTGLTNNGTHQHAQTPPAAASAHSSPQTLAASAQSGDSDGKVLRSGSVSSSSSYSRRHHQHQQHQQAPASHSSHADQTPAATAGAAAGGEVTHNHPHNQQAHSLSQLQPRLVNGNTTTTGGGTSRVSGRPPVLRSAAHSPPASPAHQTQHRKQQPPPPQPLPQHVDQQYAGRRQGGGGGIRGSTGGSGRGTPNSLKDFSSPEVQYFPMDYATLTHDASLMGNKVSGLMSPVLTLPPGAVVVPAPAFAGGPTAVPANSNLAPFYASTVLPFTAMSPVVSGGSQGVAGQAAVAVSTPSGLVPVSAFAMTPVLPPVVEPQDLRDKIRAQIEYYFSPENLQRDIFIRKKMDADGYLPIALIASFHRVQLLTPDVTVIIQSLEQSASVELSQNRLKARPRLNPLSWPIASDSSESPASPTPALTSPASHLQQQMQQVSLSAAGPGAEEVRSPSASHPSSPPASSSSAAAAGVAPDSGSSNVSSSSADGLHADVPCFVPGQLYAAVLTSTPTSGT